MNDLSLPTIARVSHLLDERIKHHIDTKTKPLGALGVIETVGAQVARLQASLQPVMQHCTLLLFAADHGVAQAGVSAFPAEVTRQMVLNFLQGGAAANVFARTNGIDLIVVDAGVAGEPIVDEHLISRRIAGGTSNFIEMPAMSEAQLEQALTNGVALGMQTAGDALAFGEMGIGNTSSAALLAHKLTGEPLEKIVGRGTGLDDSGLENKHRLLQVASRRTTSRLSAQQALQEYGGFEIATMVGAMLGAAASGRLIVIDGYIATAAALVAVRLKPDARDYCVFAHESAETGHRIMLDALQANGLLDLKLRLGEGTGALLAWPLIRCAAAMMSDMASFDMAKVNDGVSTP
ncbi:MAG: nicotinate-nucleotide--dimethylbenzimidazole phosphoribosyltransferase [Candidatus Azotimanducaceae bacterium]|jgi:nicotinate-nucleotide--dimethylbenzimidazole phosphoribosyltransferase